MSRRGLVAVVLLNLVVATAMDAVAWSYEPTFPSTFLICIQCIFNGIFYGQATVLGTLAALAPRRALVGLIITASYSLAFGYAMWLTHAALSLPSRGVPSTGIYFALQALAMQIVLWGLRLLLGWRITIPPAAQKTRQFHLSDLLELTLLCSVWFGLNLALEDVGTNSRVMVLVFARFIATFVLLGVPILLALLAERPPHGRIILALVVWYVLIDIGLAMIPIHDGDFLSTMIRQLPYHAIVSCGFASTILVNGLSLRSTGFRFQ
jgi:hypothetical protein